MKGMQRIKRGKNFAGVVLYALKPGAHHRTDPVVIGSNMLEHSASELIAEFIASASLRPDVEKPVWHNSLRLPKNDSISNEQWVTIADDYMSRLGFSDTHLRCYVMHDDEAGQHVHIIASRVNLVGGKLYLGKNENLASGRIIQDLEVDYGLTRTKGFSPSHRPCHASNRKKLSRNEQQKENREQVLAPKTFLQNTIDEILTSANDISCFVKALAKNGITSVPNIASSGRMNGFSFKYSGIAFKASQLGKTYSWARLQEKLSYEPERDNPLLFALKVSTVGDNERTDLVTEATTEDSTPSLLVTTESLVVAPAPQHVHRVDIGETYKAETSASSLLAAMESASNKDLLMTAVIKWLMSIPYLQAFAKFFKKVGKTFLHAKPSFFRSFRVWIVVGVALYLYAHINADNKAKDILILWCIPSFFILLSAYMSYLYKKLNASTIDKYDNKGTWSHEFKDSKMFLDTHTRKLTLKNGQREKTYSFDQVEKWYYRLESGGEIVAFDLISILGATGHNQSTKQNNIQNSGFFIRINDFEFPTWQIKFYPRKGKFHHQKGIKDTEEQLQRWCQIFDNIINGEVK